MDCGYFVDLGQIFCSIFLFICLSSMFQVGVHRFYPEGWFQLNDLSHVCNPTLPSLVPRSQLNFTKVRGEDAWGELAGGRLLANGLASRMRQSTWTRSGRRSTLLCTCSPACSLFPFRLRPWSSFFFFLLTFLEVYME